MKVLIPQDIHEAGKKYLRERGYDVLVGSAADAATIKREIVDADALIARIAPYPAEVIDAGKKLKVIARFGVGTDNIDVKYAEEKGIWVTIAKGGSTVSVAEHVVMFLLALANHALYVDTQVRRGNFACRSKISGMELNGKTLGVIGLGAIGRAVAKIAHDGLGMDILGYDAFLAPDLPKYIRIASSMDEVFQNSDALTLHVPGTDDTQNLVCARTLALMRPNAILVNCARGGVVNEADLYEALKSKRIFAAGIDTFKCEPPEEDNPLLTLDNFLCSPHTAALTEDANAKVSLLCAEAVDDVLNGRTPKFPVNHPRKA